ncbi:MAG: class I SAM-dependent methyltransferase [Acidimicrobiales bacterium]
MTTTPTPPGPARTPRRGHVLQPVWDGTDSIRERYDAVRPLLRARSVLDVGCASRYGRADWLHGLLAQDTDDLVGIDMNAKVVGELRAAGYQVAVADAQDFDLGRTFEVVFAGELIEHLDNVHGFLTSVRRHLAPGGKLVLTTPNAFYIGNFIYRLGGHARVHPQHTAWYCDSTLRRIVTVNGFGPVDIHYIGHASRTPARKLASATFRAVLPDHLAKDTMVAVADAAASDEDSHVGARQAADTAGPADGTTAGGVAAALLDLGPTFSPEPEATPDTTPPAPPAS